MPNAAQEKPVLSAISADMQNFSEIYFKKINQHFTLSDLHFPTNTTMVVDGLAYVLVQWVLPTLLLFVISTLILASFGKSLGVRRVYVKVLLKIFQVVISLPALAEHQVMPPVLVCQACVDRSSQ